LVSFIKLQEAVYDDVDQEWSGFTSRIREKVPDELLQYVL